MAEVYDKLDQNRSVIIQFTLFTVSTISAPFNMASADRDVVVLGKGNFSRGCVFGSHKSDSTFLLRGSKYKKLSMFEHYYKL